MCEFPINRRSEASAIEENIVETQIAAHEENRRLAGETIDAQLAGRTSSEVFHPRLRCRAFGAFGFDLFKLVFGLFEIGSSSPC